MSTNLPNHLIKFLWKQYLEKCKTGPGTVRKKREFNLKKTNFDRYPFNLSSMVKVIELWIFSHGNLYSVDRINNYRNQKLFQRTCEFWFNLTGESHTCCSCAHLQPRLMWNPLKTTSSCFPVNRDIYYHRGTRTDILARQSTDKYLAYEWNQNSNLLMLEPLYICEFV